MDVRQERCLEFHHGIAKPSKETLCNEELSQGLQGERERAGHSATRAPLGPKLCARGTGFVVIWLQTTQLWCHMQRGQFSFYLPSCGCENGRAEWTCVPPAFWKPGSPLRAHQGTEPWKAGLPQHDGEGSAPRAEDLARLNHPKISCASIWCSNQRRAVAPCRRTKNKLRSFFFPDDLILYDKTVQRTSFLLYWKNYKQKGISKKELEEKEKAFSACKCFIRTQQITSRQLSWMHLNSMWGTHWKQIPLPCLQQPYSVIAQTQRRSNFTSDPSICEF